VIQDSLVPKVISVSVIIITIGILSAEVAMGIILYRNRAIVDVLGQSLTMAIRLFIFTLIGISALLSGLIFTVTPSRGVQFDVIISALPPAAAFIFGTQMDLMKGWMFWTRFRQPSQLTVPRTGVPSVLTLTTIADSDDEFIQVRPTATTSIPPITQVPKTLTFSTTVQTSFLHI